MKKLFVGILAAICCVAFTVPVLAEVKVEGMIQTDAYWYTQSKERMAGGMIQDGRSYTQDDYTLFRIAMPQPTNRLTVRYTGEDKVVNGYIQLRAGGTRANGNVAAFGNNAIPSESAFSWEYAWIDWHVNPSLYFRFGRQDQVFANAYATWQGLGWNEAQIIGLNYGNISAQSRDAIRAFIKFNDNVRMEIQILDPNAENIAGTEFGLRTNRTSTSLTGNVVTNNAMEGNWWPRFDISLPIKVANFTIEPGFTWLKQEWDQVVAGDDSSYDIWGLTLGASAAFGPFSMMGEITWGRNLGPASSHWGAGNGQASLWNNGTNQFIEDGETLAWFFQAQFDFGPFAIQGIVGMNKGQNEGSPNVRDASEWDITQWMYGLNFPIKVTKTFTITPSIYYYDDDSSAFVGALSTTSNVDRGNKMIIGAAFNLVF